MAAIQAAEGSGRITLFEHNPIVGRKLLVTGSSRCNLTNAAVGATAYYCEDQTWMETFLGVFGVEEFRRVLDRLGIPTQKTEDGWYYPRSESAQAVVEIFGAELAKRGIELRIATHVISFAKKIKVLKSKAPLLGHIAMKFLTCW